MMDEAIVPCDMVSSSKLVSASCAGLWCSEWSRPRHVHWYKGWHMWWKRHLALLLQNLITDDDMTLILGSLHPEVKCTIIAGALVRRTTV